MPEAALPEDPITATIRRVVRDEMAPILERLEQLTGQPEQRDDAEHLTPAEVAQRWRCTRRHVYSLIARGRIRVIRVGDPERGRMLIPASELERLRKEVGRG